MRTERLPLEEAALEWLRYRHRCNIVMMERGAQWGRPEGRPDVLGVTDSGYLLEVEVKRSVSDFRADSLKSHRQFPELYAKSVRRLWYMVAPEIAEKVREILPAACGLMTVRADRATYSGMPEPQIIVDAPIRKWATRIDEQRKWRLARDMAGTLVQIACGRHKKRKETK